MTKVCKDKRNTVAVLVVAALIIIGVSVQLYLTQVSQGATPISAALISGLVCIIAFFALDILMAEQWRNLWK